MPSYVITGVSRGIGYEFLRQYSSDHENTVVGIVRDKAVTDTKISQDPDLKGRSNVHILQADLTDYDALHKAAEATAQITGGTLDYLIGNAGVVTQFDAYDPIGQLGAKPELLTMGMRETFETNIIGNVHLINLFLPLIRKGKAMIVIVISSGMADADMVSKYDIWSAPVYSASKAGLNLLISKFSAQYKQEGILFLAVCPGVVEVGHYNHASEQQLQALGSMAQKFAEYAPHFTGPVTPEHSVTAVRSVIANASIEKGDGGAFLSHLGSKQWL